MVRGKLSLERRDHSRNPMVIGGRACGGAERVHERPTFRAAGAVSDPVNPSSIKMLDLDAPIGARGILAKKDRALPSGVIVHEQHHAERRGDRRVAWRSKGEPA